MDLARGALVAEGLPAAALTSSIGGLSVDVEGSRVLVQQALGALAEVGTRQALGGYLMGRITISASKTAPNRRFWRCRRGAEMAPPLVCCLS